ncbi:MAG TPA: hemerythrin domain-containing protein [Ramlibacter sp.]|jgi:hemerythrin superfamily protein|uniref:hemerythrin domain-containing protein n=1 Tax=Ramlibacter sp. TaxID=1917967 RepID=UPI002D51FC8B|nr:hemerythrin domain-containing protein [Ramlibacter sp.]HZY20000.1 hemerythrin domain-containing protein [Ramlibacter sp.]
MASMLSRMSPSITNMIRMDHTHVLAAFHQYQVDTPARVKKGLADNICLALEVHAQLEEEIFYPALREVSPDATLEKSKPEHNEMRDLIARLRALQPTDPAFDTTLFDLMRVVMHHVADEETQLLPKAERLLSGQLSEMGARMTRRRLELIGPRSGELAGSMARSMSAGTMLAAAGAVAAAGGLLLARRTGASAASSRGAGWFNPARWGH